MEILSGIVALVTVLTLLAAVGITTLAAFALMAMLGLLTEMSFKRLFFVSFAMGLAAPILLGMGIYAAFADGSLERDLRAELGDTITIPEGFRGNWSETFDQVRAARDAHDAGEIDRAEFEARIEALIKEASAVEVDIKAAGKSYSDKSLTLRIK